MKMTRKKTCYQVIQNHEEGFNMATEKNSLPGLCDACAEYAMAQVTAGNPGAIFCDHDKNTPAAGCFAIMRSHQKKLSAITVRWPISRSEALDRLHEIKELTAIKSYEKNPPTKSH